MFVLNPGGSGSSAGGTTSPFTQKLWFFGRLGFYFVALRAAFVFMSGREEQKALTSGESK